MFRKIDETLLRHTRNALRKIDETLLRHTRNALSLIQTEWKISPFVLRQASVIALLICIILFQFLIPIIVWSIVAVMSFFFRKPATRIFSEVSSKIAWRVGFIYWLTLFLALIAVLSNFNIVSCGIAFFYFAFMMIGEALD